MAGPYQIQSHVTFAVGVASADVALSPVPSSLQKVLLTTTAACHWNSGVGAVTCTTADRVLSPGDGLEVVLPKGHLRIGAIQSAAGGFMTVYQIG